MENELALPTQHRLETWFREYQYEIQSELELIREAQDTRDIILQDSEHITGSGTVNVHAASQFLAELVFEAGDKSVQTIERSMLFALQISSMIHHNEIGVNLGGYMQELFEADDSLHKLEVDVRGHYFAENPSLRNILRYYARDIDQYRGHEGLVESAGGMTFMLVERSLAQRFFMEETNERFSEKFYPS